MKTNPNDPIGMICANGINYPTQLSKREYFAIHFSAAYMGADYVGNSGFPSEEIAKRGVEAADCLIAELNRTASDNL